MISNNGIIGREYEQKILANICEEQEARLIAIYGRRRVGKTYLDSPEVSRCRSVKVSKCQITIHHLTTVRGMMKEEERE